MKSKYLTIGGLSALSVTFITNFGFADVSSDRLDTYKANKLIPNEVQIATINSVSSESAGVAVFSPDVLSWKSYSNASSAALGKYMDWTREDFEAFFADRANASGFEDAWNFLSQTGNDHLQGATISDEDALIVLQAQLDALVSSAAIQGKVFPCEGLDFTGKNLDSMDLSKLSGFTGEQLLSTESFIFATLPNMDLSEVDFSGKNLLGVHLYNCTGLTWEQLKSAVSFERAKLPNMDLSNIDMSGMSLYGIDLSRCTGLTGAQLVSAANFDSTTLPSVDFTGCDLTGKYLFGVDFSKCNGLTGSQIVQAQNDLSYVVFPSVDFSGVSLKNKTLSSADLTKCTGLTGEQLSEAASLDYIKLTSSQYEAFKSDLPNGLNLYVDGKYTKVSHRNHTGG